MAIRLLTHEQRNALFECASPLQSYVSTFITHQTKLQLSGDVVQQILSRSDVAGNSLLLISAINTHKQYTNFYKLCLELKNTLHIAAILHPWIDDDDKDAMLEKYA
jgi:hypothetical protein